MSIYKTRPHLSKDFVVVPFNLSFSLAVEAARKRIDFINTHHVYAEPAPIKLLPEFDTVEKRLFNH